MDSIEINANNYQTAINELDNSISRKNLAHLFSERHYHYLNEFHLFIMYFNEIPNTICHEEIDCSKANKWLNETFKAEIKNCYYDQHHFNYRNLSVFVSVYYFLFDDLLLHFDFDTNKVRFLFRRTNFDKIDPVINGIKKLKMRKQKHNPEISLLVSGENGLRVKSLKISKQRLSIHENYNEDFKEIHQLILKKLSKKNEKGLVLLHGKPGTGKTSYIRYLVSIMKKNVIFLPPNIASSVTNPDLLSILIENPNSILVIEDAENIIVGRESNNSSTVSALLNICDGLLSDCLNIQIVCTFNTHISKVDNALMRKGRLIAKYEFKELEVEKAQVLSDNLGFDSTINSAMKLTDIYNQDDREFQEQKTDIIGFKSRI